MVDGPLSPTELERIDAYWRAANYLSVGQIYLLDNPLLREPLRAGAREAAAARPLGHDARPQLHLRPHEPGHPELGPRRDLRDRARARRPRDRRQRVPRGDLHRGLPEHHPGHRGACGSSSGSSRFPGGIPSHVAPETPGSIHEGGELGLRALARLRRRVRQPGPGRLLRRRRRRGRDRAARDELAFEQVPRPRHATARSCRSSTSTATRSPTPRSSRASPRRSCGRSWRATATTRTSSTGDDPAAVHQQLAATMDAVVEEIHAIQRGGTRAAESTERPRWPMIVLRTPKGWTGPKVVDGKPVEGTWRSHQVPLGEVRTNARASRHARGVDAQLPARGAVRRGRRPRARARRAAAPRRTGG